MPRLTKIYTRTGDDGMTSLVGRQRVPKDSLRVNAYGAVDELNSHIGLALASGIDAELTRELLRIQNELFHLGSELATLEEDKRVMQLPQLEQKHVDALETLIDHMTERLGALENFILPGGSLAAAQLHVARCVARRAERDAIALGRSEAIGTYVVKYLNRLSDTLFVMARYENHVRDVRDVYWDSHA